MEEHSLYVAEQVQRYVFHYMRRHSVMLSYVRQVAICDSVLEMIRQALNRRDDLRSKLNVSSIPSADSILRAVSVLSSLDTEETLKEFIIDHVLVSLQFPGLQKEDLSLDN